MQFSTLVAATGLTLLSSVVNAGANFQKSASNNLVFYWGQASAGSEKSLGEYCDETEGNIYVISFLDSFGGSGDPSLSISSCGSSGGGQGGGMAHCPDVGKDIKKCQKAGKKVMLALGGAAGSYGFDNDQQGEKMADTLWDMFGGGKGDTRPFDDAVLDGFDLDIENNNQKGYASMVKKLRQHYKSDSSKDYFVSAAPQCVYPDRNVGEALENSEIDFAFIQFYNNPCAVGKSGFNYDQWKDFAENKSPNKDIKLFLGLPGSSSAASSGYVDPDEVSKTLDKIKDDSHFGGIMMWDASQAFQNKVKGGSFAASMQSILGNSGSSGSGDSGSDDSGSSSSPAAGSGASSSSSVETSSAGGVAPTPVNSNGETSAAGNQQQQTSIVATVTSKNQVTSTKPPQQQQQQTSSAPSPAGAASGAAAGGAAGAMQTVTPDDASGDCNGQKGQGLADCINKSDGKTALNKGQSKQAKSGSDDSGKDDDSALDQDKGSSSDDDSGCSEGQFKCMDSKFAMCNFGKWVTFDCAAGTECKALASGDNAIVGCTYSQDPAGGSGSESGSAASPST